MIDISPTFIFELSNAFRGLPENYNTNLTVPYVDRKGKGLTLVYKDKSFMSNSMFPVELYEYRRGSNIKLAIGSAVQSSFADKNLPKNIYKDDDTKRKVTKLIDSCRQNMKNVLEQELMDEIRFFESTEDEDKAR